MHGGDAAAFSVVCAATNSSAATQRARAHCCTRAQQPLSPAGGRRPVLPGAHIHARPSLPRYKLSHLSSAPWPFWIHTPHNKLCEGAALKNPSVASRALAKKNVGPFAPTRALSIRLDGHVDAQGHGAIHAGARGPQGPRVRSRRTDEADDWSEAGVGRPCGASWRWRGALPPPSRRNVLDLCAYASAAYIGGAGVCDE